MLKSMNIHFKVIWAIQPIAVKHSQNVAKIHV